MYFGGVLNFDMWGEWWSLGRIWRARGWPRSFPLSLRIPSCRQGADRNKRGMKIYPRNIVHPCMCACICTYVYARVDRSNPFCFVSPPFVYGEENTRWLRARTIRLGARLWESIFYTLPVFRKERKTLCRWSAHVY